MADRGTAESVTRAFLFTDLEGSTAAWEADADAMAAAMRTHDTIVADVLAAHDGSMVKHMGDGVIAVFAEPVAAVECGIALQHALVDMPVKTRMGVHVGEVEARDGDFFGPNMNRSARVMGIAHGGQILVSGPVHAALVAAAVTWGLRPMGSHRLKGIYEAELIFQVEAPGLATEFPPLSSLNARIGNLPPAAELLGRDADLDALRSAMDEAAAVALIGPGGVGKTSLSIAAATALEHELPDGTWWIDFTHTPPDDLVRVLIEVLGFGVAPGGDQEEALLLGLAARELRLVLDNCEAVPIAVAGLIDKILAAAPRTRILATSRVRLSSRLVRHTAVAPLSADTHAVELFVRRAEEARPGSITEEDRPVVGEICAALDGLPLAIELAASRVKVLPPRDLLQRLDRRFALLRGGGDQAQTLLATLEWSFDLLDAPAQDLFVRLGAFRAPFDLEGAVAVAGADADEFDVLESLGSLVDNSLLSLIEIDGRVSYARLESVREFAALRLAESEMVDEVAACHFEEMCRVGDVVEVDVLTDRCREVADLALRRMPDLRAAIAWGTEHRPAEVLRLVVSFNTIIGINSQGADAAAWLDGAIERFGGPDGDDPALIGLLAHASDYHFVSGDHGKSSGYAERSIAMSLERGEDPWPIAYTRRATSRAFRGDREGTLSDCARVVAQVERDPSLASFVLGAIGVLTSMAGDPALGEQRVRQAMEASRNDGPYRVVTGLLNLNLATAPGSIDMRIALAEEGLEAARELRAPYHEMSALNSLALALIDQGAPEAVEACFDGLVAGQACGSPSMVVAMAEQIAFLVRDRLPVEAATLLRSAIGVREPMAAPSTPHQDAIRDFVLAELEAAVDVGPLATTPDELATLASRTVDAWTLATGAAA